MSEARMGGSIEVICGSMFSGKTEELIRRIRRAQIARQRILVFKHSLDDRYSPGAVASHDGGRTVAIPITRSAELLEHLVPALEVVAVDEVQFLDEEIVPIVLELADRGLRMILAGLDLDFRGEPFGPVPRLMALAEQVVKLQAICMVCGAAASRTQWLIGGQPAHYSDPVILVGESDVYEARCRVHHIVLGRPQ